ASARWSSCRRSARTTTASCTRSAWTAPSTGWIPADRLDQVLDLVVEPGAASPAGVVGEEDDELAQFGLLQFARAQGDVELHRDLVVEAQPDEQAEQEEAALPGGEHVARPQVGEGALRRDAVRVDGLH